MRERLKGELWRGTDTKSVNKRAGESERVGE